MTDDARLRERGSAPKGGRHSTLCVNPQVGKQLSETFPGLDQSGRGTGPKVLGDFKDTVFAFL